MAAEPTPQEPERSRIEALVFLSSEHESLRHVRLYAQEYAAVREQIVNGIMAGEAFREGTIGAAVATFVKERLAART